MNIFNAIRNVIQRQLQPYLADRVYLNYVPGNAREPFAFLSITLNPQYSQSGPTLVWECSANVTVLSGSFDKAAEIAEEAPGLLQQAFLSVEGEYEVLSVMVENVSVDVDYGGEREAYFSTFDVTFNMRR